VKLRHGILLLGLLAVAAAIVLFGPWLREFSEIGDCLELGGGWNNATSTCEGSPEWDQWRARRGQR
jgi:hypothetical protein